jgi:hypothetical protein
MKFEEDDELEIRVEEEETELRKVSPIEGALGKNASDYHNMWALYSQLVERVQSLNVDANSFVTPHGTVDVRTLATWTKMIATAKSILEGLNRMRNEDKMVTHMLDRQTRLLVQDVSIGIGLQLKGFIDRLEARGQHDIADDMRRFLYRRLAGIFLKAAETTLNTSKQEFKLLH